MPYQTIIVDDEPLALDVLSHYLSLFPNYELKGTFTNPTDAVWYINEHPMDLVFSDIEMPNLSGLQLVQLNKNKTCFIMTTAFSQYAIRSFELQVVDYLLKPISLERFSEAIKNFENHVQGTPERESAAPCFFVKDGHQYLKIVVEDIEYLESMKDYVQIVCTNSQHLVLRRMKAMEQLLAPYDFLRVHKSFLIPCPKITRFDGYQVRIGKHKIPVSQSYKAKLRAYVDAHLL